MLREQELKSVTGDLWDGTNKVLTRMIQNGGFFCTEGRTILITIIAYLLSNVTLGFMTLATNRVKRHQRGASVVIHFALITPDGS